VIYTKFGIMVSIVDVIDERYVKIEFPDTTRNTYFKGNLKADGGAQEIEAECKRVAELKTKSDAAQGLLFADARPNASAVNAIKGA